MTEETEHPTSKPEGKVILGIISEALMLESDDLFMPQQMSMFYSYTSFLL
jgi:hypothetical protein